MRYCVEDILCVITLMCVCVFWASLDNTQDLILAMCSGIIPVRTQGTICGVRDRTQIEFMQR